MTLGQWLGLAVSLAASWWGTGRIRHFALARSLLDVPNERSSHSIPTPRGGGSAVVSVVLAGIVLGAAVGWVQGVVAIALVPSGAAVALVSWRDDWGRVRQSLRFVVHIAAAAWVTYWIGPVEFPEAAMPWLGALGPIVTVLGIAWMTNLFNFMDGIDGLAAGEALTVGLAAVVLCWRAGDSELMWLLALVAAAAAGFLPWNWAPARIFLGDVGSVFLGFVLASLGVLADERGAVRSIGWVVLMGAFFVDATLTLIRRFARGERWLLAHRSHAYQRAVQAGLTHAQVSGTVMAVNGALAGLVWVATVHANWAGAAYSGALALLIVLYWRVGRSEPM